MLQPLLAIALLHWAILLIPGFNFVLIGQLAGGLYLLQLAFKLWRSGGAASAAEAPMPDRAAVFRTGFMTSALNPKIALFYGSVFATALPANPPSLLVVLLVFSNSVVWHGSLALLLSRPRVQSAYLRHQRALNRASGALVGLYGARLIASAIAEYRSRAT